MDAKNQAIVDAMRANALEAKPALDKCKSAADVKAWVLANYPKCGWKNLAKVIAGKPLESKSASKNGACVTVKAGKKRNQKLVSTVSAQASKDATVQAKANAGK